LALCAQAVLAIGVELDAALRGLRATRAAMQAIQDDSELRSEFKDWQSQQR
jgi:hypothetical protein